MPDPADKITRLIAIGFRRAEALAIDRMTESCAPASAPILVL